MTTYLSVEQYLADLPESSRRTVEEVLARVHGVVPGAETVLSYDIPTVSVGGRRFMHVAAWKRHLSVYPAPSSDPVLVAELEPYASGKGTLQFSLTEPLPWGLLERVADALAREADASG